MSYTLGEAAKSTGRSKSTILRAIVAGKISATKDEANGSWTINPAELHRLFPPDVPPEPALTRSGTTDETPVLRVQLEQERQERERERGQFKEQIDELRKQLADANEERRTTLRQLTALLTDQRPKPVAAEPTEPPKKRGWWRFGTR